jgi:hypothetical protein
MNVERRDGRAFATWSNEGHLAGWPRSTPALATLVHQSIPAGVTGGHRLRCPGGRDAAFFEKYTHPLPFGKAMERKPAVSSPHGHVRGCIA